MVSPSADYYPTKTIQTNTTAAKNIVDAVKAQPNKDDIKVVYIGTVAQTGDRNAPIHWARTGDPIKISIYDHYAISKTSPRAFSPSPVLSIGYLFASPVSFIPTSSRTSTPSCSMFR